MISRLRSAGHESRSWKHNSNRESLHGRTRMHTEDYREQFTCEVGPSSAACHCVSQRITNALFRGKR